MSKDSIYLGEKCFIDENFSSVLKSVKVVNQKDTNNQLLKKKCSSGVQRNHRKPITRLKYPGPYFCDHCEKICPSRPAMSSHLKFRHFKTGEFECKECPKVFRERFMLTNHVRACHLKIKPFACKICFYKTALEGGLKRHMKLVHGEKTPCPICGKLVTIVDLHIQTVHKEPKVSCKICFRNFKSSEILENHLKLKHKDAK